MPYIETNDHTSLYYRVWGTGAPVVFVSAWSFHGAMWEYQMHALCEQGLCCIALDRRGHGRSDDPGRGYDSDTLADDLGTLLTQLDLHNVTLVGNSMGCCEIARYLSRHGSDRVARVVFISTASPFIARTEDKPDGVPQSYQDMHAQALHTDRIRYFQDGAIKYFGLGSTWPLPPLISSELVQWAINMGLESSPRAIIECQRSHWSTDFRPDMRALNVPALLIHGDKDQSAPLDFCACRTAQLIEGSELKIYEGAAHGLFLTHRERLNSDLLAFIQS